MTELNPYDLPAPKKLLYPAYRPFRGPLAKYLSPPVYSPQPQPSGTVRVILFDDYYLGPLYEEYTKERKPSPGSVFDIPDDTYERWKAAEEAWMIAQEEMRTLMYPHET